MRWFNRREIHTDEDDEREARLEQAVTRLEMLTESLDSIVNEIKTGDQGDLPIRRPSRNQRRPRQAG